MSMPDSEGNGTILKAVQDRDGITTGRLYVVRGEIDNNWVIVEEDGGDLGLYPRQMFTIILLP